MELRKADKFSADPNYALRARENRKAIAEKEIARASGDRLEISREAAQKLDEEESSDARSD